MPEPFAASPSVTAISPTTGKTAGGDSVTITGTKLTGATTVRFGAAVATHLVVVNDGSITATAPAQAAGVIDVTVTTSGGTSAVSAASKFTYKAPPSITAMTPATGPAGTNVAITGSHFTDVDSVTFGDVAAHFVVDSDTSIHATAPTHPDGATVVTVSTPNGNTTSNWTYVGGAPTDIIGITIPRGGSVSAALDCTQKHPLLIFMPEAWNKAVMTFCLSVDDKHYSDLYAHNTEVSVNIVPGSVAVMPPEWFAYGCYIKFRSGTGHAPVVQDDDRTFMVVLASPGNAAAKDDAAASKPGGKQ